MNYVGSISQSHNSPQPSLTLRGNIFIFLPFFSHSLLFFSNRAPQPVGQLTTPTPFSGGRESVSLYPSLIPIPLFLPLSLSLSLSFSLSLFLSLSLFTNPSWALVVSLLLNRLVLEYYPQMALSLAYSQQICTPRNQPDARQVFQI